MRPGLPVGRRVGGSWGALRVPLLTKEPPQKASQLLGSPDPLGHVAGLPGGSPLRLPAAAGAPG